MFVSCVCCVFCSGLCDEFITRSEESYRVRVFEGDLEASTVRRPSPNLGCCVTEKVSPSTDIAATILFFRSLMLTIGVW
jgi:hypothetical protein